MVGQCQVKSQFDQVATQDTQPIFALKSDLLRKQYLNCKHLSASFRKCPTPIIWSFRLIHAANSDTGFRIFQVPWIMTWDAFVRALVMWGSRLLRVTDRENGVTKMVSRRLGNEAKNPSKFAHILLPDKLLITSYSIQLNWLCLNYNLVGLSSSEAPMASEIGYQKWPQATAWFLVLQDVNTAQKCPQLLLHALAD